MTRLRRVAKVFVVALLCSVIASGGYAQSSKKRKRSSQVMSKAVATKLLAAQEMLQNDQINAAKKELDAVMTRRGLKPLELANIYQFYAYVANEKEQPKKAIQYFIKAIQQDALPLAQQYQLEYNVAQLYMMEGGFEKALNRSGVGTGVKA